MRASTRLEVGTDASGTVQMNVAIEYLRPGNPWYVYHQMLQR